MVEVFKVQIEGVTSREQHEPISKAIHRAVAVSLADIDTQTQGVDALVSQWDTQGFVGSSDVQRWATAARTAAAATSPDPQLGTFEVTLDGIDLPDAILVGIANAIQQAVLPYIADLDLSDSHSPAVMLRPPKWRGLVAQSVARQSLS